MYIYVYISTHIYYQFHCYNNQGDWTLFSSLYDSINIYSDGNILVYHYIYIYIYIYINVYIYIYIYIYICITSINLRIAAVSLFESSTVQLRSNEDLQGPECSNCY